jgi:iron(III) transport system permease protein
MNHISMLPAAVPGIIVGVGFLWAWVGVPIYGTIWIIVAAFVARSLPDGIRSSDGTLVQIHGELEEGARIAGAGFWTTIRDIVVPLVRPGLGSSFMLLFIVAVREVGAALFLWNSTNIVMSVQILNMWDSGTTGGAAALALVQSAILWLMHIVSRRVFRFSVAVA